MLSCVYKSKGVPIHQLWSKDDGRLIFKAIFARNSFEETLRTMRFDNAGELRQNMSLEKSATNKKKHFTWGTAHYKMPLTWCKLEC